MIDVLGTTAAVFAGIAVFAVVLAALRRSEWLLVLGAAFLAGFVSLTLAWVALLVHGK